MLTFRKLVVAGAVVAAAGVARADPNMPRHAKVLTVQLVRAYAPCTQPNNGIRDTNVAACTTNEPLSAFDFGPRGQGRAQAWMATGGESVKLRLDLWDVVDSAGKPVDKTVEFKLRFTYHVTTDHCDDQGTVCTTPALSNVDTIAKCSKGRCTGTAKVGLVVIGDAAFPVSVQIDPMDVLDPDGEVFATQGTIGGSDAQ